MAKIMSEFKSTKPNPDEKHLKALWQAEIKNLKTSVAEEAKASRRRKANTLPLLKGSGLSQQDIAKLLKEDAELSRKFLKEAEQRLAKPPVNFKVLEKQDLKLVQTNAERMELHNPSWYGCDYTADYGGRWIAWNGEAEEVPSVSFNIGANRFDPRTQAYGEGWHDGDFSTLHAYLAFQFNPPSWGHLRIHTTPWLHGYYSLYSSDLWYTSGEARVELDTWIDVHQNFWRPRASHRRLTRGGAHIRESGRIDSPYVIDYLTTVVERHTVTVRVGVRLHCYARASGNIAKLNLQAGAFNYVYVPYVCWFLHH